MFSRDEILGGLPARRASMLLFAIECRVGAMLVRSREVALHPPDERTADAIERSFLESIAGARELSIRPTIQDLERLAPEWQDIVPTDPAGRAAIAHLLGEKYRFTRAAVPRTRRALGLDDEQVR